MLSTGTAHKMADINTTNVVAEWDFTGQGPRSTAAAGPQSARPQTWLESYVIPLVPAYNMSEPSGYTNNCGPTAASMVFGYYRNVHGYSRIDPWSVGNPPTSWPLHAELYTRMKTNSWPAWAYLSGTYPWPGADGIRSYSEAKQYNLDAAIRITMLSYDDIKAYMNYNYPCMILHTWPTEPHWHWLALRGWAVTDQTPPQYYICVNDPIGGVDGRFDPWYDDLMYTAGLLFIKETLWRVSISGSLDVDASKRARVVVSVDDLKDDQGQSRTNGTLNSAHVHAEFGQDATVNVATMEAAPGNTSLTAWTEKEKPTDGKFSAYAIRTGANPTFAYNLVSVFPTLSGAATDAFSRMNIHISDLEYNMGQAGIQHSVDQWPLQYNFRRGDARVTTPTSSVTITDAMFIAQYLAGLRGVGQGSDLVHPVNAASARHDAGVGDSITIADAMFIAQYLAGLRDAYFRTGYIDVEVGSAILNIGGTARIPVTVKNILDANGLGSYDFAVAFNREKIRVDRVEGGTYPFSGATAKIENDKVTLNYQQGDIPGPTQDITVAYLNITALQSGQTSLDLTIRTLTSGRGDNLVPARDIDGSVTIN